MKRALVSLCVLAIGCGGPVETEQPDGTVSIDSGPQPDAGPTCSDAECDDGAYCNGLEVCSDAGECIAGTAPCAASMCDEETDTCACSTPDMDGDGSSSVACGGADCDDDDPLRAPGNVEVCDVDDVDEDCDPTTYGFRDLDSDSAPDASCCNVDGEGAMRCGTDCNDMNPTVNPTSAEDCNGLDDNCNGMVDEERLNTFYIDGDGDSYGVDDAATNMTACFAPTGYAEMPGDCDDAVGSVHPGAHDRCDTELVDDDCNGTPNDPPGGCMCTGTASEPCSAPGVCAAGTITCNGGMWTSCSIMPVTEVCDGRDEDCDGTVDNGTQTTCFADGDGDGYAPSGAAPTLLCPASGGFGGCPTGYTTRLPVSSTIDCNDGQYAISPAGSESCNSLDDDCDGTADEGLRVMCYLDMDNDTYSAAGATVSSQCADPGRTLTGLCPIGWTNRMPSPADCDDLLPGRSPAGTEVCDGVDQDCDGMIDETVAVSCFEDVDNDSFAAMGAAASQQCRDSGRPTYGFCPIGYTSQAPTASRYDCAATNAAIHPDAAETCGLPAVDENCDAMANPAADCMCGDGMVRTCPEPGLCGTGNQQCSGGSWGACSVSPQPEICDGEDQDCDGTDDDGLLVTCYADGDRDGYALLGTSPTQHCPVGGRPGGCPIDYTDREPAATATSDCDDARPDLSPADAEVCSDVMSADDEDCDGMFDEGLRVTCYADGDDDDYAPAGATATSRCSDPGRASVGGCPVSYTNAAPGVGTTDCADAMPAVSPGATELCDRTDSNCSTGGGTASDEDADNDSHAATDAPCSGGFPRDDCDDGDMATNPDETETCDRIDSDCSNAIDPGGVALDEDADGDMHAPPGGGCDGGYPEDDCLDTNPSVHPGQTAYFGTPYCENGNTPVHCSGTNWTCHSTGSASCSYCGTCAPPPWAKFDYDCSDSATFQPLADCDVGLWCIGHTCRSGPMSYGPSPYCGGPVTITNCWCGPGPSIGDCSVQSTVTGPLRCR